MGQFVNKVLPFIITFILIAVFVVVFTIKYKNATENDKLKPIRWVFWALIACEVFKIFYLISQNGNYAPNRYPYVFCSIVMYAYPLFCFKKNKFSNVAMAISVIPSFIIMVLLIAVPQPNLSLIQGHSYLYHGAMTAVGIYLLTSGLYKFKFNDFLSLGLVISGYVMFSTVLSIFIGANISYFGPFNNSFLGFIYNMFGYVVGNIVLCVAVMLLCFITYGIISLCAKKQRGVDLK